MGTLCKPLELLGRSLKLQFLGDAFDHWKGSLFTALQETGILRDFAVDPMASDIDRWQQEDFTLFARLIHVAPTQIIRHRASLKDRTLYFGEISHLGDMFLDPDTGVATGHVREPRCYINPPEIRQLLDASPSRLLAIYQHVRAQRVADRVDAVINTLRDQIGDLCWCSYEATTVAMLFLARTRARTMSVEEHFATLLGRHTVGRVRFSNSRV